MAQMPRAGPALASTRMAQVVRHAIGRTRREGDWGTQGLLSAAGMRRARGALRL